jgi:hypothetical protein
MQTPTHIDSERECVTSTRLREEWNFLKTLSLGYGHPLNEKRKNNVTWHTNDVSTNLQDNFDEKKDHVRITKAGDCTSDDKLMHESCALSYNRTLGQVGGQPGAGFLTRSDTSYCHPRGSTVKTSFVSPEHLFHIQKENRNNRRASEKHVQINDDNEFKSLKRSFTKVTPLREEGNRLQRRVLSNIKLCQKNKSHAQRSSSLPSNQFTYKDEIDDVGVSACAAYQKKMGYFYEWYREKDHNQQVQKLLRHIKEVQTTPRFREAFAHIKKNEDPFKKSQRIQAIYDKCRRSFTEANHHHTVSLAPANTNANVLSGQKESKVDEKKVNKMNEIKEEKNRLHSNHFNYNTFRNRSSSVNKGIDGSHNYDKREQYKNSLSSTIEKHSSKHSYSSYETNEDFRHGSLAAAAIYPEAPITHTEECQDENNLCQYGKCFNIQGNLTGDILWNNEQNCQDYSCCPQHSNVAYPQPIMCPVHSSAPIYANSLPAENTMLFPDLYAQHNCSPNLSHYALHSITPVACPVHQCIPPNNYNTFGSFGIAVPLIKTCPTSMYGEQQPAPSLPVVPGSASSVSSPINYNESIPDEQELSSISRKELFDKTKEKSDKTSGTTVVKNVRKKKSSNIKKSLLKEIASVPLIRNLSSSTPNQESVQKLPATPTALTFWKKASPRKLSADKLVTTSKKAAVQIHSTNELKNEDEQTVRSIQDGSNTVKADENALVNISVQNDSRRNVVPIIKSFQTNIPKTPLSSTRKPPAYNLLENENMLHPLMPLKTQNKKSVSRKTSLNEPSTQRSPSIRQKSNKLGKKYSGAKRSTTRDKTGVTPKNALQLFHQPERITINGPDQCSISKENALIVSKNNSIVPTKNSKVIPSLYNKVPLCEANGLTSDSYSKKVSKANNKVIIGNDNKRINHAGTGLVSNTQAKALVAVNKQAGFCEGTELDFYKGNKMILTESKAIIPREEGKMIYVKENPSIGTEDRVVVPRKEKNLVYNKENPSISTENRVVVPRKEGNVVYNKENPSISTENRVVAPREEGTLIYLKENPLVCTEDRVVVPREEGNLIYVKDNSSFCTEDRLLAPREEGNLIYVKDNSSICTEDRAVAPREEGNVIYVKENTSICTEDKVVAPREKGDVIFVKENTSISSEDKVVAPSEKGNVIYVKENTSICTEDRAVAPREEGNVIYVKENTSICTEDKVVAPHDKGNVIFVKENTSISSEDRVVASRDKGDVIYLKENTSICTEDKVVTPREEGNVIYVKENTSASTEGKVVAPREEGNVIYVKEDTSICTEDRVVTPRKERNVIYVKENTSISNEDKVVGPCEEGSVIYVKENTSICTEDSVVAPREKGNVIYVKENTSISSEDKVVAPREKGNLIYVKENTSISSEDTVVAPREKGNLIYVKENTSISSEDRVVASREKGNVIFVKENTSISSEDRVVASRDKGEVIYLKENTSISSEDRVVASRDKGDVIYLKENTSISSEDRVVTSRDKGDVIYLKENTSISSEDRVVAPCEKGNVIYVKENTSISSEDRVIPPCEKGNLIYVKENTSISSEDRIVPPCEKGNVIYVKENTSISSEDRVVAPCERGNVIYVKENTSISSEDRVVAPRQKGNIIYVKENTSISTEDRVVFPREKGNVIYVKENKSISTEDKVIVPREKGNVIYVKENTSVSTEDRVVAPREKGNVIYVKENTSISTEDRVVVPRDKGSVIYVKENKSISTEGRVVAPREKGNVIYVKENTSISTEDRVVAPREKRNVIYVKENKSISTKDRVVAPREKRNVIYVKENKSISTKDKVVAPRRERNVTLVNENTSILTENAMATSREERKVIYIKGGTSVRPEDKIVTPREQKKVIYVKENTLNIGGDENCIVIKDNDYTEVNNDVNDFLVLENEGGIKKKDTFVVQRPCDNYSTKTGTRGVIVSQKAYKETENHIVKNSLTRNVAVVEPMLLQKNEINYKVMDSAEVNQRKTNKEVSSISIFSVKKTSSFIAEISKTTDQKNISEPRNVENAEPIGFQFEDFGERTNENTVSCNFNLTKCCENSNALYSKSYGTKSFCIEKVSMQNDTNQCFWTRLESCESGEASREKFTITPGKHTTMIPVEDTISNSFHDESKQISDLENNSMNSNTPFNNRNGHVRFQETPLADKNSITYCKYHSIESEIRDVQPTLNPSEDLTPRVLTGTGLIKTEVISSRQPTAENESSPTYDQTPPCFVFHKCNLDPQVAEKEMICTEKSVFGSQSPKHEKLPNTQRFIADTICENEQLLKSQRTLRTTPIQEVASHQPYESYDFSDKKSYLSTKDNTLFLEKDSPEHTQQMNEDGISGKTPIMNCTGQKKLDGFFRPLIHENSPIFTLTSRRSHMSATSRY